MNLNSRYTLELLFTFNLSVGTQASFSGFFSTSGRLTFFLLLVFLSMIRAIVQSHISF
jgi:hypothetical protein